MINKTEKVEGIRLYLVMVAMLLSGTACTIIIKWQNSMVGVDTPAFDDPSKSAVFTHPYVQTANMFIGEMFCLAFYGARVYYRRRQKKLVIQDIPDQTEEVVAEVFHLKKKKHIHPLFFAIPAFHDFVASSLGFVSFTLLPASIVLMLGNVIILVTCILSIIFLKRKFYRHHWASIAVIFVGVGLVGLAAMQASKKTGDTGEKINPIGIALLMLSLVVQGSQFVLEEKLLKDY